MLSDAIINDIIFLNGKNPNDDSHLTDELTQSRFEQCECICMVMIVTYVAITKLTEYISILKCILLFNLHGVVEL